MKKSLILMVALTVYSAEGTTFLNISSYECQVEASINGKTYQLKPKSRLEIPGNEFSVLPPISDAKNIFADIDASINVMISDESTPQKSSAQMVYAKPQEVLIIDFGNISGGKTYLKKTLTIMPLSRDEAREKYPTMMQLKKAAEDKKYMATFLNTSDDYSFRVQPTEADLFQHKKLTLIYPLASDKGTGIAKVPVPKEGGSVIITAATANGNLIGKIETFTLDDVKPGLAYKLDVQNDAITAVPMMEVHAKRDYKKYYNNLSEE